MPIPTPKKGEEHDAFMSRCIGDAIMSEEEVKQTQSICYTAWKKATQTTASKMVYIDEDVLNAYMLTSSLTTKDLDDLGLLKQNDPIDYTPSRAGEGKPTQLELEYKANLKSLYHPVQDAVEKVKDKTLTDDQIIQGITDATNNYVEEAGKVVDEYIPHIFAAAAAVMILKAPTVAHQPGQDNDVLQALLVAQKYDIYKHANIALMNVISKIYWKNYMVTTYARRQKQ